MKTSIINPKITASAINCPNSYRQNKNGWCLLHLEGSPNEIGRAYSYLIVNEMTSILAMIKALTPVFYGHTWDFFVANTKRIYGHYIYPELEQELLGMMEGFKSLSLKISYWELVTWNCYASIFEYWWKIEEMGKSSEIFQTNSFIATGDATHNGEIILAHNMGDNYYLGQWFNCLLEIVPTNGNKLRMQTYYGSLSGLGGIFLNNSGLIGSFCKTSGFNKWDSGPPCFIRLRKALQYSDGLDSFASYLIKENMGDNAATWCLGDINNNEIMRLDLGSKFHSLKKRKNGYFIAFNESESHQIRNLECDNNHMFDISSSSGARRKRLTDLVSRNYGKIDIDITKTIMRDRYDVFLERALIGPNTILSKYHSTPFGTIDIKIITSSLAVDFNLMVKLETELLNNLTIDDYCKIHSQWDFLKLYLHNRIRKDWDII